MPRHDWPAPGAAGPGRAWPPELMGAQTLQRLAVENDARARRAPAARQHGRDVQEHGLREALRRRDEPFGDGYARVDEPEGRRSPV